MGLLLKHPPGTPVAAHPRTLHAAALVLSLLMGCVVTDPVDFPTEQNAPPSVVTAAGTAMPPFDQVLRVNTDEFTGDGGTRELSFDLDVQDANVSQRLAYQLFVNFHPDRPGAGLRGGNVIPATGMATRHVAFRVPLTELTPAGRCYKLEVLVSSGFSPIFPFREPLLKGDVAAAVWFVEVTGGEFLVVDPQYRCP